MSKSILNEGGSGGHMFHPFNLPSVNTGKDLIDFFYKAAKFISRNPEQVIPSDSTSLKVDGANTAFKLVRGPSGNEFAFDRGSMKPIDIEGITLDRLVERWSPEHGMVKMGKILLAVLNRAYPKIKKELVELGLMDKNGNPDSTKFINSEFCWKETNQVVYDEDFIALHGINQYYEKSFRGVHRPGAVRPLIKDEKTGKMIPTKQKSTEVLYDESVFERLKEKLKPEFLKAVGPDNPDGFNVYTVIPVKMKEGESLEDKIKDTLEQPLTLQIREPRLNEWNFQENGVATMSLKDWLLDKRTQNPRSHHIKMADGSKKGAMSKEVYGRVLAQEPVESMVQNTDNWDVPMAINGALFYYAIENLGASFLQALTSPLGDLITKERKDEGIVLRSKELFGVEMVKITGNFISQGSGGKFAQAMRPQDSATEKEEEPEQGQVETIPEETNIDIQDKPLRIAMVPGAFKPPHKGHLNMVKRLSEISGIDKVLVVISKPVKKSRNLPISGKEITAEQAKSIWELYINSLSIKKTEIIISPGASPVQLTYDFVQLEPEPNNELIAPNGAEVYFGCGDKDDDSARFDGIINKAREDLKIKIVTCPLNVTHKDSYMKILESSPEMSENMPSIQKSMNPKDFHAKDMRFVADMSAKSLAALEMFKSFVPGDLSIPVLGILGINAIDNEYEQELPPEENFEDDGEISQIQELNSLIEKVIIENFQSNMKKRLSISHSFYLDQGRQDLIKHGAPFNQQRPKDKSNAFKAT